MMAIVGLLPTALMIVLLVLGIRKLAARPAAGVSDVHLVRQFFQYVLLLGLLFVSASGVSGLIGRLLDRGALVEADQAELALSVAFTVVGLPLFAGVALWSRRGLTANPAEARSFAWTAYTTVATLTSLVVSMFALYQVLAWAAQERPYDSYALGRLVVWGAVWAFHWWLGARLTPIAYAQPHHLLGSLIGLGTAAAGIGVLLSGALEAVFDLGGSEVLVEADRPIVRGAVLLVVGAPVWFLYWVRTASHSQRNHLWLAYVLLPGVGGGLITAVVSASTVLYDVLVWLVGHPEATEASRHFQGTPGGVAAAVVGVILWWYHHAVLREAQADTRTEVLRIYEYLMAGIGLVAAAVGLTMLLVALVEALTGATVLVGSAAVNTLITAATLLVVGGPVWWLYWSRVQAAARQAPEVEHASPTRRIYLFVLFGIAGIAAVVALLVGVYFVVEDVLEGVVGTQTLRRIRFPIGVLVSAGAISGYHWTVYRGERARAVAHAHGPHFVLLVGPRDGDLAHAVAQRTGARVTTWPRTDQNGSATPWSADDVLAALGENPADDVIVLSDAAGLHAIPVDRH